MANVPQLCPRCKERPKTPNRSACRACEVKRTQEWMAADPVRAAARHLLKSNNTRAKRYGAMGSIKTKEWLDLVKKYNNACACCGLVTHLTIDHVKPLSLGGSNTIDNVQPLCIRCNGLKHAREIDFRSEP